MSKFKVKEEEVQVLRVTVLEGRGITAGKLSDAVDTPDPYVKVRVIGSPNSTQRTRPIPNETNPKWNKEFTFFLDSDSKTGKKLEIIVMDEDFGFDDTVGVNSYDISKLEVGKAVHHTFQFGEKTFLDVKMLLQIDVSKDLRYSYDLCDDEKEFLKKRKKKAFEGMKKFLSEDKCPNNADEAPVLAVMGSGGGFRAMCGLSGVFSALQETGVLDCATYVSGLSGSSWYISTLYANSAWPDGSCEKIAKEIKDRIKTSFVRLLTPAHLVNYYEKINKKRSLGYPVSFTDFFGCLVGDTLLQDKNFRLTYVRQKVSNGAVALPLCTAVHVEKDVSAQVFSEWVEFSPYEVGLYKYGVFLKTEYFGGKFYKGRLIRDCKEQPLHFLQGIWGSAFSILFQRLLNENDEVKSSEKGKNEGEKQLAKDEGRAELAKFVSCGGIKHLNEDSDSDDEAETDEEDERKDVPDKSNPNTGNNSPGLFARITRTLIYPFVWMYHGITGGQPKKTERKPIKHKTKEKDKSSWKEWLEGIIESCSFLSSREGRAAEIHNIFRGLCLECEQADDKGRIVSNKVKNAFVVDGGLDFNSPYPLLLRPERNVKFILSFDFSQRDSDNTPPFEELLLAEEWAREHEYPFPPVKDDPLIKDPDIKELYVFEDKNDVNCPVVMHFVLINKTFKTFKEPGVPRETEEEKSFGDFPVFDDEDEPYSSFKFDYAPRTYERLYHLMKFNTLLNIDVIKEKLAGCIESRRNNPSQ